MLTENDIVILTIDAPHTDRKVFTVGGTIDKIVENDAGEEVIYVTTFQGRMRFQGGKFYHPLFTAGPRSGSLALDEKRMEIFRE